MPSTKKKMRDFTLTNLFFVTGFSFLAFTAGMKLLDGEINTFLLKVGLGAIGLGILFYLISFFLHKWEEKNSTGMSSDRD
jgi:hypothetical protein